MLFRLIIGASLLLLCSCRTLEQPTKTTYYGQIRRTSLGGLIFPFIAPSQRDKNFSGSLCAVDIINLSVDGKMVVKKRCPRSMDIGCSRTIDTNKVGNYIYNKPTWTIQGEHSLLSVDLRKEIQKDKREVFIIEKFWGYTIPKDAKQIKIKYKIRYPDLTTSQPLTLIVEIVNYLIFLEYNSSEKDDTIWW